MKNLKLVLVSLVLALAVVNAASADGFHAKSKKIVKITIQKAVHNPGLVKAMYKQLDKSMLNNNQHVYIGRVYYGGTLWLISGNYGQWNKFFTSKWLYYKEQNTYGIKSR